MNTIEIVTLVCTVLVSGPFAMIVSQALKRCGWSERWRFALALVVGLAVGVAQTWISGSLGDMVNNWGGLTALEVVTWAGLVWASSQAWYHLWFADTSWMLKLGEWPDKAPSE